MRTQVWEAMMMTRRRRRKTRGPKAAAAARDLVVLETRAEAKDTEKMTEEEEEEVTLVETKKKRVIADDILVEILSRLPGSSLSRLRHASKHWLSLTREPLFIELHLHRSRTTAPQESVTLTHCPGALPRITSIDYANRRVAADLSLTMGACRMSPSCNGIVCIFSKDAAFLLNPTTGELLHLPPPTDAADSICLLGFSAAIGQYKILRFYRQNAGPAECELLAIGRCGGRWRQPAGGIRAIDFSVPRYGTIVNDPGVIYLSYKTKLVSFDVEDEVFDTVWLDFGLKLHVMRMEYRFYRHKLDCRDVVDAHGLVPSVVSLATL